MWTKFRNIISTSTKCRESHSICGGKLINYLENILINTEKILHQENLIKKYDWVSKVKYTERGYDNYFVIIKF